MVPLRLFDKQSLQLFQLLRVLRGQIVGLAVIVV